MRTKNKKNKKMFAFKECDKTSFVSVNKVRFSFKLGVLPLDK